MKIISNGVMYIVEESKAVELLEALADPKAIIIKAKKG